MNPLLIARIIFVITIGLGVVMATDPQVFGITKIGAHWLAVAMAMLGAVQSFLPKVQGADVPPVPPKSGIGGFLNFLPFALASWFVAGAAQAQAPVVKTAILPWRARMEAQQKQPQQQQQAPAPVAQDHTPAMLALIAQLALRPQPESKVYIYSPFPPQQQLPIAGQPQQALPIAGQPQQQLPIAGQPQQALPIQGQPQQVLPPGGSPQQQLPIQGSPQQTPPQAGPQPAPVVIPNGPALPPGTPPPAAGPPQQKLPTGAAIRYVPALYRR